MTLSEIIEKLKELHGVVRGVESEVFSYRGDYAQAAVAGNPEQEYTSEALAASWEEQLGKMLAGWKGGEYPLDPNKNLYVVGRRDYTGPVVVGIEMNDNGVYEFVLEEDDDR